MSNARARDDRRNVVRACEPTKNRVHARDWQRCHARTATASGAGKSIEGRRHDKGLSAAAVPREKAAGSRCEALR
jgi:hypothetical protein